ncbi:MAG: acyl-CoA dehydrogenase [Alphaproteobacteria bacterium]|nr:acyl-CoA dehydrogenase [Alphaproteobacteria bacterium]
MPSYAPPVRDIFFAMVEVAGLAEVAALPGCEDSAELAAPVLDEAAKLASEVLAPLNPVGDREGCVLENGAVRTPTGFREAYARFVEGGWNGMPFDPEYGGQGLPWLLTTAVGEMWQAANMAFGLCPLLTQGTVELLSSHGSAEQKALYLPPLIEGVWTGTMNLTEPQAGSDLGALRSRAVPDGDAWKITGQKIFITHGEHDMAENIVHLVLARVPDAPAGPKGISLFIVPKFLPGADGRPGPRNDLRCVSLEHKLGIKASPTAVMSFGDGGGATGFLIGEANRGLEYMFTMMNNARLNVGLQGVAVAERAYQKARAYARERVQSRAPGTPGPATIIHHADVRRMLMTMKAETEAARALALLAARHLDVAKRHPDDATRAYAQRQVDLLIPVVKAWCSEVGMATADTAIQVHGGMGFIEETGVAQHLRDARITAIYEGTNGIQAADLVGRKLLRDKGFAAREALAAMRSDVQRAERDLPEIGARLAEGVAALEAATAWLLANAERDPHLPGAASTPYLRLFGTVAGGWVTTRAALAARAGAADDRFLAAKLVTARFYADHLLPRAGGFLAAVTAGPQAVMALAEDDF